MRAAAKIAMALGSALLLSGCFYPVPGYYGQPAVPYAYPQVYGELGFGYGDYGGGRGYDHGGYDHGSYDRGRYGGGYHDGFGHGR